MTAAERVMLTGATGFLGSAVARALHAAGHPVRALLRPATPRDVLAGVPVEPAPGGCLVHALEAGSGRPRAYRARQVVFIGDDLGDLPAFRLVEQLRREGMGGLLVCSASHEEDALSRIADVVVQGPSGVATWLEELADALEARRDAAAGA